LFLLILILYYVKRRNSELKRKEIKRQTNTYGMRQLLADYILEEHEEWVSKEQKQRE